MAHLARLLLSLLVASLLTQRANGRKIVSGKEGYYFDRMGRLIITSHELAKQLARVVVHKSGKFPSFLFAGGCPNSILGSGEHDWNKQRRIIHTFIIGRTAKFAALARSTATHIMENGIVEKSNGKAVVDINRVIYDQVKGISSRALGNDDGEGGPLPGDVWTTTLIIEVFLFINVVSVASGFDRLLDPLLRSISAFMFRRTENDRALRKYIHEAKSRSPFVRELVETCGEHETLGHIYSIRLGSTIPEAWMIRHIIESLAADQDTQSEVYQMIQGETLESLSSNTDYVRWIDQQCNKHFFFPASTKYTSDSVKLGEHTIPKGQDVTFRYDKMRDEDGVTYPWGFGARSCPGSSIGRDVVRCIVYAVLHRYRIDTAEFVNAKRHWRLWGLRDQRMVTLLERQERST